MNGAVIWLNSGRVLAPEYYWKAVCDPIKKQSIFFYAENNIGNVDLTKAKLVASMLKKPKLREKV